MTKIKYVPAWILSLFLLSAILLTSCTTDSGLSQSVASPTDTGNSETSSTDEEIATAIPATAQVQAVEETAEPLPTAPPTMAATIAPTSEPTADNSATPEATANAEPTATALPEGWFGPSNFPEDMNPLTGETVEDPNMLQRRPIAIKVSNYPPLVRPQAGINNSDLVFEHYAEGGATRFTAVFYSQDAHTVGSVRSARIIDFEIPVMYDAAFGFSGAAGPNKERFGQVDWFERIISPDFGHGGFYRAPPEDPDTDFWHTMFTDTYRLRDILVERGLDVAPQLQNGMIFSADPPESGTPAKQVEIGYRGGYVTWWYDSGAGRYFRWNDGERHLDANRSEQINFKNIVVVSAEHVDTWIPETEVGQGAPSIEIQIWGEGPATIFRNGQRFDGRWHRTDPHDMLAFTDLHDNPLPLAPGNTWFQLVPLGFDKLYVTS
ncbi:MAG: DUF3048 domain-containing protein [Candidatus Promineifilaceae bacterium]|nr:DUF3048 domain-containing protein [Candidatus Promineifilaceae bacterium]